MLHSNLKSLADEQGISIRQLSRDVDHAYEVVRRLYNDEMERYPRILLYRICIRLNITIDQLLVIRKD